jgi:amino acid permease
MLEDSTSKRVKKASLLGLAFPLVFYICIGFLGYAVYQDKTKPNFLLSFTPNNIGGIAYSLTFFSFVAAIVLTFPIYFFEARNKVLLLLNVMFGKH